MVNFCELLNVLLVSLWIVCLIFWSYNIPSHKISSLALDKPDSSETFRMFGGAELISLILLSLKVIANKS